MTQYAALIYEAGDPDWTVLDTSDKQATMAGYAEFGKAAAAIMRGGAALYPTTAATAVRVDQAGQVVSTDGPFAETNEVLTGFYLLECADLDEAISWAAKIPAARVGTVEVRPVIEFGDGA